MRNLDYYALPIIDKNYQVLTGDVKADGHNCNQKDKANRLKVGDIVIIRSDEKNRGNGRLVSLISCS